MARSLNTDLEIHFENQENCDVRFKVGGHTLGAHKFMLQVRNQVLYNMVVAWNLGDEPIPIEDMEFDSFKALIRFIYTDEISLSNENVFIFLHASTHFKMPLLEKLCADHIEKFMTVENVCILLDEAINFESTVLQESCKKVFSKQTIDVLKDKSFCEISQTALSALLDCEDCNVLEIEVFRYTKIWMAERCRKLRLPVIGTNMRKVLGDALYKIRFPTMTVQDFANSVTTVKGLLTDTEMAQVFQMITLFDTADIECPFPSKFRCQHNLFCAPIKEMVKLFGKQVLYNHYSAQYCNMTSMVNSVADASDGGIIYVTSLRLLMQCCADLANSSGTRITADSGNHPIRKEIKDEFSAWTDSTNTKNVCKMMTKYLEMRSKLDKVCDWP